MEEEDFYNEEDAKPSSKPRKLLRKKGSADNPLPGPGTPVPPPENTKSPKGLPAVEPIDRLAETSQELIRLRKENESLQLRVSDLNRKIEGLEASAITYEERCRKLENQASEQEVTLARSNKEVENWKTKFLQSNEELRMSRTLSLERTRELISLKDDITILRSKNNEQEQKYKELESRFIKTDKELSECRALLSTRRKELDTLKNGIDTFKKEKCEQQNKSNKELEKPRKEEAPGPGTKGEQNPPAEGGNFLEGSIFEN